MQAEAEDERNIQASQRLSATLVARTTLAGLTAVLFGMSNGASSGALQNLIDLNSLRGKRKLGPLREGLIIASAWAGTLLGTLGATAAPTARLALIASSLLHCMGGLVVVLAPTLPVLVAGRLLTGLGNGLVTVALNTYTGEIAPPPVRGGTIALQETSFLTGALSGAWAARHWLREKGGWRWSWGISCPLGLLAFLALLQMPDTPRAIFRRAAVAAQQGNLSLGGDSGGTGSDGTRRAAALAMARAEAEQSLCRLRGLDAPDRALHAELDEIERLYAEGVEPEDLAEGSERPAAQLRAGGRDPQDASFVEIVGSRLRRQLLLTCTVAMAGPAFSGHSAFEGYGTQIFHTLGYGTRTSADIMIGFFAVRLAVTLPDFLWLDTIGRRTLMAAGLAGMGGCYIAAAGGRLLHSPVVAAGSVLLSAAAYQAAVAPLAWIIPTEVFPADMRMKGSVLSSMAYAGFIQLILLLHPLLAQRGPVTFLLVYASTSAAALLVNRALLPETVGRSLEEIERDAFSNRLWRRSSMRSSRALLGMEVAESEASAEIGESSGIAPLDGAAAGPASR